MGIEFSQTPHVKAVRRGSWALLFALLLQLLLPAVAPQAFGMGSSSDARIAVCTANGIHYVGMDEEGRDAPISPAPESCVFCLPMLGGHLMAATVAPPAPAYLSAAGHLRPESVALINGRPSNLAHPPRAPPLRSAA